MYYMYVWFLCDKLFNMKIGNRRFPIFRLFRRRISPSPSPIPSTVSVTDCPLCIVPFAVAISTDNIQSRRLCVVHRSLCFFFFLISQQKGAGGIKTPPKTCFLQNIQKKRSRRHEKATKNMCFCKITCGMKRQPKTCLFVLKKEMRLRHDDRPQQTLGGILWKVKLILAALVISLLAAISGLLVDISGRLTTLVAY